MRKIVIYVFMLSTLLLINNQVSAAWEADVKFYPARQQHLIKIIRWDEDDPAGNILYGCEYNGLQCMLGIFVIYRGTYYYIDSFPMPKKVAGMPTMGELAKVFREQGYLGKGVWSQTAYYPFKDYCYYLGYYVPGGPSTMTMTAVPGGVSDCPTTEIIPTYCSIEEPYIELNHGSLSGNSVNGNTVSKQIHVTCSNDFNLKIRSKDSQGYLSLGGGLKSQLKVNGADLGLGYSEVVGPSGKTFTLSSTLSGYTSGTGVFQGSSVIVLGLP
ncbi:MrpH family fimbial adhesin [Serratia ureilytica]|uniref:MrpH family fimbial adhesin n=1 Tax=Serratia ureilytica TaxID=300181 RepID=UPI00191DB21E|nr:hypothetical protein [Serratia ureilytica]MBL0877038.1 hypothetical protein [Serratia ureilytica]MDN2469297.1 hypothetical protein [Serratia ureilytica]